MRDRPHRHVTAIAPAGNAKAMVIDGRFLQRLVYAGHDVAKVAVAEIFHVGTGEGFTLSVAAARIGHEDKVSSGGKRYTKAV